jgi:hypothetical protein
MSGFSTACFVLSAMDDKIEHCVCIKFGMELGKSSFGEHSLSQTVIFE